MGIADSPTWNMSKPYKFDTFKYVNVLQKEISYFLAVAEVLSLSKAAENLGVQQSGLSKAVQRLESDFGHKLFQRKNNGLVLTRTGEHFLKAVKATKGAWEQAFRGIIENSENPSGLLKIGFYPSFGQKYFPAIVNSFAALYPNMEIEVHTMSSTQVTRKVNDQELDIGIVISSIKFSEIVQRKIDTDFIAAFQKDASKAPLKVLFNPDMHLSAPILRKYSDTKKIFIKDYELIAKTCRRSNCLGLLPQSVAENFPELQQVGGVYLKADVSVITHKEKMAYLAHRKVFNTVVQACLEGR